MKIENPTRLRVGMTGKFNGKSYRVAGRAVLGVMEGGVIYDWNEFNLDGENGESATLVYEEAGNRVQWRWFEQFNPQQSISAEEAAIVRHGNTVALDGITYLVTEVHQSRVYHVEGEPPEGERSGSCADYFNAENGEQLLVVSWTGNEVEYYRGRNLSAGMVATGFNLRGAELVLFRLARGGSFFSATNAKVLIFRATLMGFLAVIVGAELRSGRPPAVVRYPAPSCTLAVGARVHLEGTTYRVISHELTEVEEVGQSWRRHEFGLEDESGGGSLLIFGMRPKVKSWLLLTPAQSDKPFTPGKAGNLRRGETIRLDDKNAGVTELFREQPISMEGQPNSAGVPGSGVAFGLIAQTNNDFYLVRWDASAIHYFRGRPIRDGEMKAAFPSR